MSKDDELSLVLGSLDQSILIRSQDTLYAIEKIVENSIENGDAFIALNACKSLIKLSKISGITLAKGLYLIKENWEHYNMDEPFERIAYVAIGVHPDTVNRYVEVWELFAKNKIPKPYVDKLKSQNIKSLIPIAKAVKQGYELDDKDWKALANAPDFYTIQNEIREIKGQEPRKSTLQLRLDEYGSIWAWKRNERYFVGSLEIDDEEEVVQQAISKITRNSGILQQ